MEVAGSRGLGSPALEPRFYMVPCEVCEHSDVGRGLVPRLRAVRWICGEIRRHREGCVICRVGPRACFEVRRLARDLAAVRTGEAAR